MKIKNLLIASVFLATILCSAGFVNAQTIDNSALIAQLRAEIQSLMQQIAALLAHQSTTIQTAAPGTRQLVKARLI